MKKYLSLIFILQLLLANEPIAVVSKVRGKVNHKMIDDKKYKSKLLVNTPISLESQIRTDNKSFVKLIFLDDGTSIAMYSGSEIIIKGNVEKRMISKKIELISGIININVTRQMLGEFTLVTPNSELTCTECKFWILFDPLTGDELIKESGNISILNPSLNRSSELVLDTTLISLIDNEFQQFGTPVEDIRYLELLMLEADERVIQYKKDEVEEVSSETTSYVVVIKLKNAINVERKLVLTYNK
jgi:hypothetical protein